MKAIEALADGFGRVREATHAAAEGLPIETLTRRPDDRANTIAWLVWHIARGQDAQVADVAGLEQVWIAGDWMARFSLPFGPSDMGYGQGADDVAEVRADADLLLGYLDATHEQTMKYLDGLRDDDLDRVVDDSWDPPVTLGVRLVSVISDDLQHAGQAAYLRGMFERVPHSG